MSWSLTFYFQIRRQTQQTWQFRGLYKASKWCFLCNVSRISVKCRTYSQWFIHFCTFQLDFLFSDWLFSKYTECIENVHGTQCTASKLREVLAAAFGVWSCHSFHHSIAGSGGVWCWTIAPMTTYKKYIIYCTIVDTQRRRVLNAQMLSRQASLLTPVSQIFMIFIPHFLS